MLMLTLLGLIGWVVILDGAGLLVPWEFNDQHSDEPSDAGRDEE